MKHLRFHLSSIILGMIISGVFIWVNTLKITPYKDDYRGFAGGASWDKERFGFPFVAYVRGDSLRYSGDNTDASNWGKFSEIIWSGLLLNLGCLVCFALSTMILLEFCIRFSRDTDRNMR